MEAMKKYDVRNPGGFPSSLELREGFYNLKYGTHAMERFMERSGNDPVYPKILNVQKDKNVLEIYSEDDKMVNQFLVRIQYKWNVRMFLVIVPQGEVGFVKTIWFSEKRKKDEEAINGRVISLAISNVA